MTELKIIYTFTTNGPDPVDLSSLFLTPGVAHTSDQNISWQITETIDGDIVNGGPIGANGTLLPSSPSGFASPMIEDGPPSLNPPYLFFDPEPDCAIQPTYWQVQSITKPDPAKQCDCPPPPHDCPASSSSGNSVELATRRFIFEIPLLSLIGLGQGTWSFGLNYRANSGIEGNLGKNFSYPQLSYLQQLGYYNPDIVLFGGYSNIQLVTTNLTKQIFIQNSSPGSGPGFYAADGNTSGAFLNFDVFARTYTLTGRDGTVTTFSDFGTDNIAHILNVTDRFGNKLTYDWGVVGEANQLKSVTDSYGRVIEYSYYGAEANYQLKQIRDYLGRQLDFQYDDQSRLVAVITPAILKATPDNTFPGGTAYVFQYDATGNSTIVANRGGTSPYIIERYYRDTKAKTEHATAWFNLRPRVAWGAYLR